MPILVATDREVVVIDVERGTSVSAHGISDRPTCLAADALVHGRAWCGTHRDGVFRTDDGGRSWRSVGLAGRLIMAIAASPSSGMWCGWVPNRAKCGARRTLVLRGSRRADWRHCPRRRNGRFRRDRTLITFAGSRATRSNLNDSGLRSRQARSCPRSMAAAPGATASLVVRGTPTSSPFIATHPILCASLRATDISRATTPARRGARRAPVSRSATCAAWRSIRGNRTSSWYQRRPDRTPRTWLADRMAGCIAVSLPSAGSASATAGRSHPAQSRRCFAPARNLERCGPPMSAACTVRTMVGRAGAASIGYATSPQHLRGLALLQ